MIRRLLILLLICFAYAEEEKPCYDVEILIGAYPEATSQTRMNHPSTLKSDCFEIPCQAAGNPLIGLPIVEPFSKVLKNFTNRDQSLTPIWHQAVTYCTDQRQSVVIHADEPALDGNIDFSFHQFLTLEFLLNYQNSKNILETIYTKQKFSQKKYYFMDEYPLGIFVTFQPSTQSSN
jgi:hypothetical protein